jgi:hypothetical protein
MWNESESDELCRSTTDLSATQPQRPRLKTDSMVKT